MCSWYAPVMQHLSILTLLYVPASVRLLPAGLAVVAWASSKGKPIPNTAAAWLACAAFGVVDGTLFQGKHGTICIRSPLNVASFMHLVQGLSPRPEY
jgi:hypothetical protein